MLDMGAEAGYLRTMTRVTKQRVIERRGVNRVVAIVEEQNWAFNETARHNDFGLDGHIEFTKDGIAIGTAIGAQIKCGKSYVASDGAGRVYADIDHMRYWLGHVLPVVLIVHNPETGMTYWEDIGADGRADSFDGTSGMTINVCRPFGPESAAEFQQYYMNVIEAKQKSSHLLKCLGLLARPEDELAFRDGIRALFQSHRSNPDAWRWLIIAFTSTYLREHNRRHVLGALTYLGSNPDIYWSDRNLIAEPTLLEARAFFSSACGRNEVEFMLSLIDEEDGWGRGGSAQAIQCIVQLLAPEFRCEILHDLIWTGVTDRVRCSALLFWIDEKRSNHPETFIPLITEFLARFPDTVFEAGLVEVCATIRRDGMVPSWC